MRATVRSLGVVWAAFTLGGCNPDAGMSTADAMARWKGKPVESFAEVHGLRPIDYYDTGLGVRTYIYQVQMPLRACGVTFKTEAEGKHWIIRHVISTCPIDVFI